MARMTKAQREWRPNQIKKPRSIKMMFASTVLTMEAFVVFFGALTVFGLWGPEHPHRLWVLIGGSVFAVLFILCCAVLRKSWGVAAGWVLQVWMVLTGFFLPAMFALGAIFVLLWWYAVRKGAQLDRENAERYQAELDWQARHGG
ncbi:MULTISPECIES: DUF4233 domain-containing protein [Kocuria]|uniref:DUF4233 domain-containing protein n=1 Tax=Kocuria subflava TaxID=1736139 RepID=A0A846TUZ2_9MICC|nr:MULTISPECIES: DUF4233 domain-containing protein [Kocuria]NKE09602.1 DUF4233 domain-containing protein [Kocuria subflava]